MYQISVSCIGLTDQECKSAVVDIIDEFRQRSWHINPQCHFKDKVLTLTVINDFDESGQATLDEYSDAVHACIKYEGNITFSVNYVKLV